jgi:hypothetical protein
LPDASALTLALAAPLNVTLAPLPPVIVPEMLQVAVAVKLLAVTLAPLIVIVWLAGLMVKPLLLGVTV